ncbi:MAG: hypothetical protein ACLFRI_04920 [Candidatus Izemoplasmataceae bacterium]
MEALIPVLIIITVGSLIGAALLFFSTLLSKLHPVLLFLIPTILLIITTIYFIELYQNTYGLEGIPLILLFLVIAISTIVTVIGSIIIAIKRKKGNN